MDDDDAGANPDDVPLASSLFIHWWHESGAVGSAEEGNALRGTIRDLSGRTIGSFAGLDGLFRTLQRVIGRKPGRPP